MFVSRDRYFTWLPAIIYMYSPVLSLWFSLGSHKVLKEDIRSLSSSDETTVIYPGAHATEVFFSEVLQIIT